MADYYEFQGFEGGSLELVEPLIRLHAMEIMEPLMELMELMEREPGHRTTLGTHGTLGTQRRSCEVGAPAKDATSRSGPSPPAAPLLARCYAPGAVTRRLRPARRSGAPGAMVRSEGLERGRPTADAAD